MSKGKYIWIIGAALIVLALVFVFSSNWTSSFDSINNFSDEIIIYKSLSCGCCEIYANYFKKKGNSNVKVMDIADTSTIRDDYGVPDELASCHTTIIGDYFVEGHIPLEAVNKLIEKKPDIAGIAMPGMPSGSPGMPGAKTEDFVIYAVNKDGSYEEFMRL